MPKPITIDGIESVVSEATLRASIRRAEMMRAEYPGCDAGLYASAIFIFASVMPVTQGWAGDFDAFLDLPETTIDVWLEACREVNPHWFAPIAEVDTEKKETRVT